VHFKTLLIKLKYGMMSGNEVHVCMSVGKCATNCVGCCVNNLAAYKCIIGYIIYNFIHHRTMIAKTKKLIH